MVGRVVYSYDPDNQAQVYAVQKPAVFLTNKGTSDMPIDEHCCNPSDVLGSTNIKTVVTVSTPQHSLAQSAGLRFVFVLPKQNLSCSEVSLKMMS